MIKICSIFFVVIVSVLLAMGCTTATNEERFDSGKENFLAGNFDESFKQLLPLAKQGNPEAQYAVGYMYFYGLGTKQDMREAVDWMQQAAETGQPQARLALRQLQQDHVVTEAFSNTRANSRRSGGVQAVDRSVDVPNQLSVTWPQPSAAAPASSSGVSSPEPAAATPMPSQGYNPVGDTQSSNSLLPSARSAELGQASHQTVLDQSGHYAVQLMGAYTQGELEKFAEKLSMTPGQYQIVKTQRDSRNWYVLTYGDYPNLEAALQARKDLPKGWQVMKPWVRNLEQFDEQNIA